MRHHCRTIKLLQFVEDPSSQDWLTSRSASTRIKAHSRIVKHDSIVMEIKVL